MTAIKSYPNYYTRRTEEIRKNSGVIRIVSRAEMEGYGKHTPDVLDYADIISVNDASDGYLFDPHENNNLRSYIFKDDVPRRGNQQTGLFQRWQAVDIVKFLLNRDRSRPLIIHCWAGVSRSAGISVVAAAIYGYDMETLYKDHPYIQPNWWVMQLLADVYSTHFDMNGKELFKNLDKFEHLK